MLKSKKKKEETLGDGCEIRVLNVNIQGCLLLFYHLHLITFAVVVYYYVISLRYVSPSDHLVTMSSRSRDSVSYTHLTLPTILLV